MNVDNLLQELLDSSPKPKINIKKSNNKLCESFNSYYNKQQTKDASYLPLLIYCLAYNNYLLFIEDPKDEDHILFKIKQQEISDNVSESNLDANQNKTVALGYSVPEEELAEWEDVIKYYRKDFYSKIETSNEKNLLHNLLVEGKKDPLSEEKVNLYTYAQNISTTLKENNNLPDFRKCVMQHLSEINLWTQSKSKDTKLLYFIYDILKPLNYSSIYNPIAGPGIETFFLNDTQTYHGCTFSQKSYYLGKLLMLTQKKWKKCTWELLTNSIQGTETYNFAILDLYLELKNGPFYNPKDMEVVNVLLNTSLDRLDDKGKMVCVIPNPIEARNIIKPAISKILDNNWLRKIIAFRDDLVILYIDKEENPDDSINLFDIEYNYINESYGDYSTDDWDNMKGLELFLKTSPFEIEKDDYFLTYNHVAKHIIKNEDQDDFYFLRLGSFLSKAVNVKTSETPDYQILEEDLPKLINKDYPLKSAVISLDADIADEKSKYCSIINKTSLLFNSSELNPFRPLLFDDSFGDVYTNTNALTIDTSKIDPEYLVLEISKIYFQEQLRQSLEYRKNWKGKDITNLILSLYIKMPNCKTSFERQKQIVNTARWRHIEETALNIGQDLSVFSSADNTYLRKGIKIGNGKYTIHNYLGHGGFGRTYLAMNNKPRPGEPSKVAIKEFFVNNYQLRDPETNEVIPQPGKDINLIEVARKKFHHEADKILKLMDSQFIINVYDVFDENNTTYYVMEYIEKGNLKNYTDLIGNGCGLPVPEAIRIIREIAQGLKAMHSIKMNHLDIKPSNILITNDGHVRLIDFGTVRDFSDGHNMTTICNIISQGFSAPEINTLKGFSPQADIYSLGATLKYMLEGDDASDEESSFMSETVISLEISSLIDTCMASNPLLRPQNIDDFLSKLSECYSIEKK